MKNSELPAFILQIETDKGYTDGRKKKSFGLTKREYFSALAMQGCLSNSSYMDSLSRNNNGKMLGVAVIEDAVRYADELLKQLESK